MTLFEINRKKWDLTCLIYCNIGTFGHIALPFEISWWFSVDAEGNKCREISFSFLCFACCLEYWNWSSENRKQEVKCQDQEKHLT